MGIQTEGLASPAPARSVQTRTLRLVLLSLLALAWLSRNALVNVLTPRLGRGSSPKFGAEPFDWKKLTADTSFNWVECFDGFQCAKFEVPLDYTEPNGLKANIAVAKLPSKYAHDDANYRGPIFYNPGGPGGSGVGFIVNIGSVVQLLFGDEYDHIGFDPRGVGASTPSPVVFATHAEGRLWNAAEPMVNLTESGVGLTLARSKVVGDLAVRRAGPIASNMGTAQVARDIMAMNAAHGRDKVMYWGGSYGTVLGATLAAMFPDKIERLVIDSVMDATTYYDATWSKNLLTTDDALEWLFTSCSASPSCALYAPTPSGVQERYQRILASLKRRPVSVINGPVYGVVDHALVQNVVFMSLYRPFTTFPYLASALANLEKEDGSLMLALGGNDDSTWSCDSPPPEDTAIRNEVHTAIACGDGDPVDDDVEELEAWVASLSKTSSWGDLLTVRIICAGWKIHAKDRFTGPFVGNTSHPIFIMNNIADPVTPLESANKTAQGFPGSAVVAINAPGHGAIVTPSLCALQHLRAYIRDGQLPPDAFTLCQTYKPIFPSNETTELQLTGLTEDQQLLHRISEELRAKAAFPELFH